MHINAYDAVSQGVIISMRMSNIAAFVGAFLICGAHPISASVIAFDDVYAASGNVATYYQSSLGVTISGTYSGVIGGVGNGDPGNWHLYGTNGSAFLGCNEGNLCSPTFNFVTAVNGFSLDIGDSYGSTGTFTVDGYLGGTLVSSDVFTLHDPNTADGTWETAFLSGVANKVTVASSGIGAYGIDNVVFDQAGSTPEPSTFLFVGIGLISAVVLRRQARAL